MAVGVRHRFIADLGLGVTECSVPSGAGDDQSPKLFIALSADEDLTIREYNLGGDPAIVKSRSAKLALDMVRRHLLGV
jgi:nicotinamide-nucleotide amidase